MIRPHHWYFTLHEAESIIEIQFPTSVYDSPLKADPVPAVLWPRSMVKGGVFNWQASTRHHSKRISTLSFQAAWPKTLLIRQNNKELSTIILPPDYKELIWLAVKTVQDAPSRTLQNALSTVFKCVEACSSWVGSVFVYSPLVRPVSLRCWDDSRRATIREWNGWKVCSINFQQPRCLLSYNTNDTILTGPEWVIKIIPEWWMNPESNSENLVVD